MTFKDYLPIEFDLNVDYMSTLDGISSFVDLGTHVFYKMNQYRTLESRQFEISSTKAEFQRDDDFSFNFKLSNAIKKSYFSFENQENVALPAQLSAVPVMGENMVTVSGKDFIDSSRKFFASSSQSSKVEIPFVNKLKAGELAAVLTWE